MEVIPASTRPREAIRNAEILYSLEGRCIQAGEENLWKSRVEEELEQLKTFRTEGRLRYEAALQARDHAAIQHINILRYEVEGWIRRLEQCIRACDERKRQRETPVVILPPKPKTFYALNPRLEDITATEGIQQVESIANIRQMYAGPMSSVVKPPVPAKKLSLKPLLVPVFLIALIWWGATIFQQISRPDAQMTQSTSVPALRTSNSTTANNNIVHAPTAKAASNSPVTIAEIDASEDAVVARWLQGDEARRFKTLWKTHEIYLNQYWQDNFQRNWAYRTYHSPADIRLFDKYAVPSINCSSTSDGFLDIASYCPTDRTIYVNAGVMAIEFSGRYPVFSVLSLAHEWGHHVQELKGTSLTDMQQELQADCFAGTYLAYARAANIISASDYGDARKLIQEMGDSDSRDRSHGTSSQRYRWLVTGYEKGVSGCLSGF